ncbi:hypothetical protein BH24ACT20_BH24ACT20_03610 [soil metagenome]|jgi:hypothetical protein
MRRESLVQLFGVVITLATILVTIFAVLHLFTG